LFLKKKKKKRRAAMAKRLIPSLNRVLVEKVVQPNKTAAGILLPETTKQVHTDPFSSPINSSFFCSAIMSTDVFVF
jgi:hypothetical protein